MRHRPNENWLNDEYSSFYAYGRDDYGSAFPQAVRKAYLQWKPDRETIEQDRRRRQFRAHFATLRELRQRRNKAGLNAIRVRKKLLGIQFRRAHRAA